VDFRLGSNASNEDVHSECHKLPIVQ